MGRTADPRVQVLEAASNNQALRWGACLFTGFIVKLIRIM